MKGYQKYFDAADKAIPTNQIATQKGTKMVIKSSYKGAVSSFSASLIMSGLIPTLQFYSAESDKRDANYGKILDAVANILNTTKEDLKKQALAAKSNKERFKLKKDITDAAVALKIMMRSYEFVKD